MDLFPVSVTRPDGAVLPQLRLAVRDGVTSLWRWGSGGPERVMETTSPLHGVDGPGRRYQLDGVDGTWQVRYTPGDCGCGSPMKSWSPRPHRQEAGQ